MDDDQAGAWARASGLLAALAFLWLWLWLGLVGWVFWATGLLKGNEQKKGWLVFGLGLEGWEDWWVYLGCMYVHKKMKGDMNNSWGSGT